MLNDEMIHVVALTNKWLYYIKKHKTKGPWGVKTKQVYDETEAGRNLGTTIADQLQTEQQQLQTYNNKPKNKTHKALKYTEDKARQETGVGYTQLNTGKGQVR